MSNDSFSRYPSIEKYGMNTDIFTAFHMTDVMNPINSAANVKSYWKLIHIPLENSVIKTNCIYF